MIRSAVEELELVGVIVTFGGICSLLRTVEVVCACVCVSECVCVFERESVSRTGCVLNLP